MLTLLNISKIALVDELRVEFERGLNLLTGETGSGKSIIVDALGVLIGGRFSVDLLKADAERGFVEGLFVVAANPAMAGLLSAAGIELADSEPREIIIRRELSRTGRNKIFINNQLATQGLLRELRPFLVDIHGQGDQQTLFDSETHRELLDAFASLGPARQKLSAAWRDWDHLKQELADLQQDEAEKLQLVDVLKFQITELNQALLLPGEDDLLEEERRRLLNTEQLTSLSAESLALIYEEDDAALARLRQAARRVGELTEFEPRFREYLEGLQSACATLEDLAYSLRDFSAKLEFSPVRQEEIEHRLVEIGRLKRKYGGTIDTSLEHLARAEDRLRTIEHSSEREAVLTRELAMARAAYLEAARAIHSARVRAARKLEQAVERDLAALAMESARFQIQIKAPEAGELATDSSPFRPHGIDQIEFYFSANPGEPPRPLARVASGGEASRLMLVLKTVANASEFPRTIVFDEIDAGIGGRTSEAVGARLKQLAETNQVLCVTHQAQIARFADHHLLVNKEIASGRTHVSVERLDRRGQVEEIARMLTGAEITDSARRHARELLK